MMYYFVPFFLLLTACVAPRQEVSPYLVGGSLPPPPPPPRYIQQSEKVSLPPPERKKTRTVFLDPGHGGQDRGTSSKSKRLLEKNLTLETARRVERLLTAKGYRVFMSRRKDVFIPLLDRVAMATKRQAHIYVSIHFNFTKNTMIKGAEVFYYTNPKQQNCTKLSKTLGTHILKKITEALPTPSRGVKSGNFCVIRETSMPSVLVEAAFLSNPGDARLLLEISYRQKIAQAISDGVEEYFKSF